MKETYNFLQKLSILPFRKDSLFATIYLFGFFPRHWLCSCFPSFSLPSALRGKEVPCKTIVYNSPSQEAYDTLEISRFDLPMSFCYT